MVLLKYSKVVFGGISLTGSSWVGKKQCTSVSCEIQVGMIIST